MYDRSYSYCSKEEGRFFAQTLFLSCTHGPFSLNGMKTLLTSKTVQIHSSGMKFEIMFPDNRDLCVQCAMAINEVAPSIYRLTYNHKSKQVGLFYDTEMGRHFNFRLPCLAGTRRVMLARRKITIATVFHGHSRFCRSTPRLVTGTRRNAPKLLDAPHS